jgi:hypothetical protein
VRLSGWKVSISGIAKAYHLFDSLASFNSPYFFASIPGGTRADPWSGGIAAFGL